MLIRERTEQIERLILSKYACKADSCAPRDKEEEKCPTRTEFQRDRDRIIHSKAFRRLSHKTQVFLSPEGDHYRTRLTHTLETSQLARTIARSLRLNEDLTEAIALGHDLGHTPFGHAGERALNELCPGGYIHAEQSVRIVEKVENGGEGLNLTKEVRNGIERHTEGAAADTLEGRIVRYADKIAYCNHDIDDAIRAGVLKVQDIPWDIQYRLGRTTSERITSLSNAIVEASVDKPDIVMESGIYKTYLHLNEFLFEAVYTNPIAKSQEAKAEMMIKMLYEYFCKNPEIMPEEYKTIMERDGKEKAVCDYISGMSDRYAVNIFNDIFIPKSWA
ncbi:MAG: deoxyguanosinetriphosphate triphosphohydrolase [Oscillospiraceae bacterium]|nr:deoxyguanosinetriphosphate triphosphohydrolase [Oscillospiraceae bacterium]